MIRPEGEERLRARPAGVLPLRLGRQPVARSLEKALFQLHRRADLVDRWIAHLLFGEALLLAQPPAVGDRLVPGDRFEWSPVGRRGETSVESWNLLEEATHLAVGDLGRADREGTRDQPAVGRLGVGALLDPAR